MSATPDRLAPGQPYPLGAHWDGLGINFAVFSAHAHRVELCVFNASGRREIARYPLPECTDEVWHGYLPDSSPGLVYGYRAHGPYEPTSGYRFNANKLLLDPYARQLTGSVAWSDALFGYRAGAGRADTLPDRRDSAAAMPKGVVVADGFEWGDERAPRRPWVDTVIYEAHLRGLTMLHPDVPGRVRGTFVALSHPSVVEHLSDLGVTAVELLPVQAFLQDRFLVEKGLRNYWGYSTLSYFAPEPGYLATGSLDEIKATVRQLHAAGIEVILDVVYNHTCEGSELGPTLSWRGLDNASYYRLLSRDRRACVDHTGCGNTLNTSHPRVLQMVMDSLRYWVSDFRVDGFRFDLGAALGRETDGFDEGAGLFDAIRQDPVLSRVKIISEPWDVGPGGYQLGRHPPGFAEWNDRFRDGVRRFWRGDNERRPNVAACLTGSSGVFDHRHRRPWASVNYVASHDGQPLRDAVSYVGRHNAANGEGNRDGHGENFSANHGAEGDTEDEGILGTRARLQRAMLATVLFSAGTPMLLAGDESNRTQRGNNNAYCQDNECSWVDWKEAERPAARSLRAFVSRLTTLRRRFAPLRPGTFPHGRTEPLPGMPDTAWFDQDGRVMCSEAWNEPEARTLAMLRIACGGEGVVDAVLLLLNADAVDQVFTLPRTRLSWRLYIDSAEPERGERPLPDEDETLIVGSHSLVLLGTRTS